MKRRGNARPGVVPCQHALHHVCCCRQADDWPQRQEPRTSNPRLHSEHDHPQSPNALLHHHSQQTRGDAHQHSPEQKTLVGPHPGPPCSKCFSGQRLDAHGTFMLTTSTSSTCSSSPRQVSKLFRKCDSCSDTGNAAVSTKSSLNRRRMNFLPFGPPN